MTAEDLMEIEREFAQYSKDHGYYEAFATYLSKDAVLEVVDRGELRRREAPLGLPLLADLVDAAIVLDDSEASSAEGDDPARPREAQLPLAHAREASWGHRFGRRPAEEGRALGRLGKEALEGAHKRRVSRVIRTGYPPVGRVGGRPGR